MRDCVDVIKISEEDNDKLQKLHYEYFCAKDVMAYFYDNYTGRDKGSIKNRSLELVNKFTDFELFKLEITKKYVKEPYNTDEYVWEADFANSSINIYKI